MGNFPSHTLIPFKREGFKLFPLLVLASLLCAPARAAESETPDGQKRIISASKLTKTTDGTTFSLQIDLERDDTQSGPALGRTVLRVEDAASRTPLSGLHPLIWMFQAESTQDIKQDACVGRIKTAMKGLLSAQADVDLNNFMLLTLNDDQTISVINPQIAFSKTKLHSLISLPGQAADWILAQDAHKIFISLPEKKEIAVVSAEQFKLVARIPVKGQPGLMALSPQQDRLWVTHKGEDGVEILDTKTHKVLGSIPHGSGYKALVFTSKDGLVWMSDTVSSSILAVNSQSFEIESRIAVGTGGQSLAMSEEAGLVFLSHRELGSISVIDIKRRAKIKDIKLAQGVAQIRTDPSGRWLFAVNPIRGHLDVIDTADLSLRYHREGLDKPDALSFSRAFAYIRNGHGEKIHLLDLSLLKGNSSITMVAVPIGQSTPDSRADLGVASPFAPTPDGKSMFIAHPSDRSLYFYAEGMMATSGTHLNYGRKPRAVLLVDRSLREIEPGVYAGHFTIDGPRMFDVALVVENPRVASCWKWQAPTELFPGMAQNQSMPEIVARFNARKILKAGEGSTLKFHVKDHKTGRIIDDPNIHVLILKAPVGGQWRPQVRYRGKGNFELDFTPPHAGEYRLLVAMPDQGKDFGSIPDVTLGVKGNKKAAQALPEAAP